ncbi:SUKH-4 family immunity protein [Streptomyces sp. NPDC058287]|uniref:SUKH-4 family immunity protein n=1 Tax=unclassified Streptomyces TaxID=2593676 RepID=UPI0036E10D2C
MNGLKFELTYDELASWFGSENVERSVRADAEALGFSGHTLDFLCAVGIPSTPKAEVGAPSKEASLRAFYEIADEQWTVPERSRNWIVLGNLTATTVAVDTVTGTVYGFYEGAEDPVPLHADVSSLAYTIYAVKRALPEIAVQSSFVGRKAVVQRVQQDIERHVLFPSAKTASGWPPSRRSPWACGPDLPDRPVSIPVSSQQPDRSGTRVSSALWRPFHCRLWKPGIIGGVTFGDESWLCGPI